MNIFLDSIGCRLNQSEIERYANQFRAAGHILVSDRSEADLIVVNTCAVTMEAASDSRQKIRQAAQISRGKVIATGCWSTLYPEEAEKLPGVQRVIPNIEKDFLVSKVLDLPLETFDLEPVLREPVPGARLRTRAFLKVQDGCDNRCTFCITTIARGHSRSRKVDAIVAEINSAVMGGAQEVVLTGVHLGSWGHDFDPPHRIENLVRTILRDTDVKRLRLSSLEPWDLYPDFFSLWENPRLCRHLHLPLQSGSTRTLRRMARKITPESFTELIISAKKTIPDVAITTDVIVGFPGESQEDFDESLDFVKQMEFAGGHVFTYSVRPGTAAARFIDQVPRLVRKQRNALVRNALVEASQAYRQKFLGSTLPVLWETAQGYGPDGWQLSGLTDNYLRVNTKSPTDLWNEISDVRLTIVTQDGLEGRIENS